MGLGAIESIVKAREESGPFTNIFDFCQRIDLRLANKKVLESLIQAGALDSLEGHRSQLFAIIDKATSYAASMASADARRQASLFDSGEEQAALAPALPDLPEWEQNEKLKREKEVLGFFVSGHPLDAYRLEVEAFSTVSLGNLHEEKDGKSVSVCGLINAVKTHYDRRNRPMAFFTVENFTGSIEALAFSDVYEQYRDLIAVDQIVLVQGKLSCREEEKPKILANKVLTLAEAWNTMSRVCYLTFELNRLDEKRIQRIQQLLRTNQGQCRLHFQIKGAADQRKAFYSTKYKVRPNPDLIHKLQELLGQENVRIEAQTVQDKRPVYS